MRRALAAAALAAAVLCLVAAPAGAQEKPRDDGERLEVLRIPFERDERLTPYTFQTAYPLLMLVYDSLAQREPSLSPRPWLARSIRRSADGMAVDVRLRRGVRWHDGRPLTARDVEFTFRLLLERRHPRFTPQLRDLREVRVTGPLSVRFLLRRPSLGFEDQPLADVPIVPRHLWEGLPRGAAAPPGAPVGTGPYRVEPPGRLRYRLEANHGYFRGRPLVERIEVPRLGTARAIRRAFESRRLDAVPVARPGNVRASLGTRLAGADSYTGITLVFNVRRPPFDDPAARRAVAQSIDLVRLTRSLGAVPFQRLAVPADRGPIHPAASLASRRVLHRFDPAAARVAFAELGLPPLRVLASADDLDARESGRQVVLALRRAGARAFLRTVRRAELAAAVGEDADAEPRFDLAIWPLPPLATHDPAFLTALFGDPDENPLNRSGYRSARFDRLALAVAEARTTDARRDAVERLLTLLASDAPVVPLAFPRAVFAVRPPRYDGWYLDPGLGILDKRSFLNGPRRLSAIPIAGDPRDPLERASEGPGALPFLMVIAGLLGAALVLRIAAAMRAGRR